MSIALPTPGEIARDLANADPADYIAVLADALRRHYEAGLRDGQAQGARMRERPSGIGWPEPAEIR